PRCDLARRHERGPSGEGDGGPLRVPWNVPLRGVECVTPPGCARPDGHAPECALKSEDLTETGRCSESYGLRTVRGLDGAGPGTDEGEAVRGGGGHHA
ncbi:LOW QUALITY PROTEIN: conserved hypothetical protein, partial [Streptomyces sp. SPB78]